MFLTAIVLFVSCNEPKQPHAVYVPVPQLEQSYGQLITVSNAPTQDQHGTGDRLGIFQDNGGTVWGIPITISDNGDLLGCAPPMLREFAVTDTLPADAVDIIGAVNEPSEWRGGTGKLELLVSRFTGTATLARGSVRRAQDRSGPSASPLKTASRLE